MEIWIATGNQGKLREFERLLTNFESGKFQIKSIKDLPTFTPRPEDGKTFVENARIKAKSLRAMKNSNWIIGEDSGLEVEGLGNLPGIHSARYAGAHAKDTENCLKVLKMLHLKAASTRKAVFKSTLVVYSPNGEEFIFEGDLKGEIAKSMRGTEGFGYDPIFVPDGESKTISELGLAAKNKFSHRAKAIEKMLSTLSEKFI